MSTPDFDLTDPQEAARFLNRYARKYSGGAFASPPASELAKRPDSWRSWTQPALSTVAVTQILSRDSVRHDFTGRTYRLPWGSWVVTHLASTGSMLPDLASYDYVYAHVEDPMVTGELLAQGRSIAAVRVSAASEIIACWGKGPGCTYELWDTATLSHVRDIPIDRAEIRREVSGLSGWLDDFPFYSDGSWSALSLRGFNPADPTWGIKPAEMSKAWWREHPEAVRYDRCDWTPLAEACPVIMGVVAALADRYALERVRLLRMAGRPGKVGRLSRHTDVTDRAAGTRDGQITRFHIPLITDPRATMSAWNLAGRKTTAHLAPGQVWYLDARKPHAVDNASGLDRVHLVVDVVTDQGVRDAIAGGEDVAA